MTLITSPSMTNLPLSRSQRNLFRTTSIGEGERASLLGGSSEDLRREYVSVSSEDFGVSLDPMTSALRKCHRFVITPMRWMLRLLAWHPYTMRWSRFRVREAMNTIYTLSILIILLYHYYMDSYICYIWSAQVACLECRYVIRYIIPNALHLLSYLSAWYYFRIQRSGFDQIEALIQTVFLQVSNGTTVGADTSQHSVFRMLRRDMSYALMWIVTKGASDTIQDLIAVGLLVPGGLERGDSDVNPRTMLMIALKAGADIVANTVHGMIIGTYCMYSGLLGLYVDNLSHKIQHRSYLINQIIQEVTQIYRYQRMMNNGLGIVVSMVVYLMLFRGTNVFFDLMDDSRSYYWNRAGDFLALIGYVAMIVISLVRAARYTRKCKKLQKMTVALHAGGYRDATSRELDSLSLFVGSCPLGARLFSTPITLNLISKVAFMSIVMMMVFGQLGYLNIRISSTVIPPPVPPGTCQHEQEPYVVKPGVFPYPFRGVAISPNKAYDS